MDNEQISWPVILVLGIVFLFFFIAHLRWIKRNPDEAVRILGMQDEE